MNRIDHKEAAEALLELVPQADPDADSRTLLGGSVLLQRAQVHATLAAAEVTPMPAPEPVGSERQAMNQAIRDLELRDLELQVANLTVANESLTSENRGLVGEVRDLSGALENAEQSRRLAEGLLRTARGQRDDLQDRFGRALAAISAVDPTPDSPMGRVGAILEGTPRAERVLPPGYRPQYAAGGPVPSDGPGQ